MPRSRKHRRSPFSKLARWRLPIAVLGSLTLPWRKSAGNEPPGTLGLPFIGETLAYKKDPHRFFEERVARFGNVFKTRILGKKIVAFVGPDAFTFFADNPNLDRHGGSPSHVEKLLCRESLPLIDGEKHRQMRRLVLNAFSVDAIQSYLPIVQRIAEEYAERWGTARELVWVDEYKKLSAAVCARMLLGTDLRAGDSENLVSVLDGLLAGLTAIPISLPFTTYGKALRSRDHLLTMSEDAIRQRERTGNESVLSRMMDARDGDAALAPEQIRAQGVHMFFAAYGGIFRVLSLLSLELVRNPEVCSQAREEVDEVSASGAIGFDALMRLPYLERVTFEVRRRNRIFASTFFDRVTAPIGYEGHEVPAGWKATGALYATMQDGEAFTQPAIFDPDRFSPERDEHHKAANAYVPQGGGSEDGHRCPAEDLTTHIMKLVGVVLLRSYEWELLPQDLTLDGEPSPLPKDGIRVVFSLRNS